eukprot:SAG22_NODE_13999_length_388_cov_0.716263_1_plen_63_part_10
MDDSNIVDTDAKYVSALYDLTEMCTHHLELWDRLIPHSISPITKTTAFCLQGDTLRYMVEFRL